MVLNQARALSVQGTQLDQDTFLFTSQMQHLFRSFKNYLSAHLVPEDEKNRQSGSGGEKQGLYCSEGMKIQRSRGAIRNVPASEGRPVGAAEVLSLIPSSGSTNPTGNLWDGEEGLASGALETSPIDHWDHWVYNVAASEALVPGVGGQRKRPHRV